MLPVLGEVGAESLLNVDKKNADIALIELIDHVQLIINIPA